MFTERDDRAVCDFCLCLSNFSERVASRRETPKARGYWSTLGSLTFCSPTGNNSPCSELYFFACLYTRCARDPWMHLSCWFKKKQKKQRATTHNNNNKKRKKVSASMIKAEAGLMFLLMCFAFQISKEAWTLLEIYSTWWGETLRGPNCVLNGHVDLKRVELLLSFFLGHCISAST